MDVEPESWHSRLKVCWLCAATRSSGEVQALTLQGPLMIWLFERGDEVVRLETRIDDVTKEYVVAIAWADRPDAVERYGDLSLFRARILALEKQLASEHWSQTADSPTLLADVWRGPFSS